MSLPYDYYPAVLYAIGKISEGYTETAACDEANITVSTFKNYIKKDMVLQDLLVEADQRGKDAMADALVQIDNHHIYGHTDPKMAAVISKNIMWLLDKRDNKRFGTKVQYEHNITADRAITDALAQGKKRAGLIDYSGAIDVAVEAVVEQTDEEILAEIMR